MQALRSGAPVDTVKKCEDSSNVGYYACERHMTQRLLGQLIQRRFLGVIRFLGAFSFSSSPVLFRSRCWRQYEEHAGATRSQAGQGNRGAGSCVLFLALCSPHEYLPALTFPPPSFAIANKQ